MATFNPSNAIARSAFETQIGGAPGTFHDQQFVSESFSGAPDAIEPATLAAGYKANALDGKAEAGGTIATEFDTERHVVPLALAMVKSATPTNPTGSVFVHRLGNDETDVTFAPTMVQEISRDDGEPTHYTASRLESIKFSAASGGLVTMEYVLKSESFNSLSAPIVGVDPTPNTHNPVLRGIPKFALRDPSADNDIHVQVSSIASLPASFDVVVKVSTAASYGAIASTVYVGLGDDGRPNWSGVLVDSTTGDPLGTGEMPVEIWQESVTGIEVGDDWEFTSPRTIWTPSYSTAPKLNATGAQMWVDNRAGTLAKQCFGSWEITMTPPLGEKQCAEGRWRQYDAFGQWSAEVALSGDYVSLLNRHRRDNSQTFALRLLAQSADPITGAFYHAIQFDCPQIKLTGETKTISGPDDREEALVGTCEPGSNLGYTAPVTATLTNTIADLTA